MSILGHFSNEPPRLFETFSTYKIFTLELISIFINLRRIKTRNAATAASDANNNTSNNQPNTSLKTNNNNDFLSETPSENSSLLLIGNPNLSQKDGALMTGAQELRIINLILKSIKRTDVNVNDLVESIYNDSSNDVGRAFSKELIDQIDCLSFDTMLGLRNLISDLRIYMMGPNLNDSLIRPWSVLGKYVRRCVIVYERMQFDKLVDLCKKSRVQFKQLSDFIYQLRKHGEKSSSLSCGDQSQQANAQSNAGVAGTSRGAATSLFLHDESNLTITSEWFNRSANAVDCSGMDLEPLDESLSQQNLCNTSRIVSEIRINPFDQKALTSTASAQRTQSALLKSTSKTGSEADNMRSSHGGRQQVTFQIPLSKLDDASPFRAQTPINPDSNLMPPPPTSEVKPSSGVRPSSALSLPTPPPPITNGFAFSRRLAEYFVAQQAFLLENNEHDALSPLELEQKIDELIRNDSSFIDAYYLRYLNCLRLNDYPAALKALHDYFDRGIPACSVALAPLNLCSLEFRFGNRDNSLFALKEAITSAHQEGDNISLQHCLSWLYKIEPFNSGNGNFRKNFLIKSACSRSINYELYTLATFNLHYLARSSIGKREPQAILNLLNKTDIANLKMNSKVELNLLSQCHKACLWGLYGQKKTSSLFFQMLLTFFPKSNQNRYNTESQCIAMCYLSLELSRNGQYSSSQSILNHCKEIYATNIKTNSHCMFTENTIAIERNLLSGKWSSCRWNIQKLASVNIQQACLHEMNIHILEGNFERAKEIGSKIVSLMSRGFNQSSEGEDFGETGQNGFEQTCAYLNSADQNDNELLNEQLNIRFNFIQIYIGLREYSNALIMAIKLNHEIRQLDFNYEFMTCCLLIAKILIHMEHPEQALKYIHKCIIFILSNGTLLDQAKMHYLYAKCLHLLNKANNIETCISHMYECVEKLESIQGSIYLISAYAYLSLLLNESGNIEERNAYAGKFRQLREQLPLVNYLL